MVAPVQLTLPDPLQAFAEEQARRGGFASVEEYIRHVLRTERDRRQSGLDQMLLAGLNSGEPLPVTDNWRDEIRTAANGE